MPRIYCKDGVSLSVQASDRHYSYGKTASGEIIRKSDEGPWYALEVGFLLHAEVPKEWSFIENHCSALSLHDRLGVPMDIINPIYCVDATELRSFIEAHGGEAEGAEMLSFKARDKFEELRRAMDEETAIWKEIAEGLPSKNEGLRRIEMRSLFFDYDQALANTRKLEAEWQEIWKEAETAYTGELKKLEAAMQEAAAK
jgi:hypothetical protein